MGNLDFSYFYMELNELLPLNSDYSDAIRERLFLTDEGKYSFDKTNDKSKVFRYLGGSLVITRKTSFLNKIRGNFDGHFAIQDNKTSDQYKTIVEKLISLYNTEVIIT